MFVVDDVVTTPTHSVSSHDSIPTYVMNTSSLRSPVIPSPDTSSAPSNVIASPQPRRLTRGFKLPYGTKIMSQKLVQVVSFTP